MPKVSPEYTAARKQEILDGARRAFSRFGYEGATVARLEAETGVSRGAIFNYFENKQALFVELAHSESHRYLELLLDEGVDAMFREISGASSEWLGVLIEAESRLRHNEEFVRRMDERASSGDRDRVLAWLRARQADGTFRDDVDARAIALLLTSLLNGLALRVAAGDPVDIEPLLQLLHDALAPRQ